MNHSIAFFEIPAGDFARAVAFYQTVFAEKLPVCECGKEKMAFFMEGEQCVGAVSFAPGFSPSPHGVLLQFDCADVDAMLSVVKENGGCVVIPKTKIEAEGKGHFAVFGDTEGNHIGLYCDK